MYEILRDFLRQNRRERDEKYGELKNERQTESFINFLQKGGESFADELSQKFVEDVVAEIRNKIADIFYVIREERRLVNKFHSAIDNVVQRISIESLMTRDQFMAQDQFYDFLNSAFFNQEYFERLQEFDMLQRKNANQGSPKINVLDADSAVPRVVDLYFQAQLFFQEDESSYVAAMVEVESGLRAHDSYRKLRDAALYSYTKSGVEHDKILAYAQDLYFLAKLQEEAGADHSKTLLLKYRAAEALNDLGDESKNVRNAIIREREKLMIRICAELGLADEVEKSSKRIKHLLDRDFEPCEVLRIEFRIIKDLPQDSCNLARVKWFESLEEEYKKTFVQFVPSRQVRESIEYDIFRARKAVLAKKDVMEEGVVMNRMLQNLQSQDEKEIEIGLNIFSENFTDMPIEVRNEALQRIEDLIIAHEDVGDGSLFRKAFLRYKNFLTNEKKSAQDGLQFFEEKISGLRNFAASIGADSQKAQLINEFVEQIVASQAVSAIAPAAPDALVAAIAGASIAPSSGEQVDLEGLERRTATL